jgi:hypothetical protein
MEYKMSKYLVNHHNITPENYPSLESTPRKVKSLFLPSKGFPEILHEEPLIAKSKCFLSLDELHFIPLHPCYHMYVDKIEQVEFKNHNIPATYIYRQSLQTYIGLNTVATINGNAILFGSVSAMDQDNYDVDYSVPYELIEQVARYYDHGIIK